jgi:hypothetical protein
MADDSGITITIEGEQHKLDDFELGELEWLEEYTGAMLDDADALRSIKTAVGFVYLIKRRTDPNFTIEQARKIKMSVFDEPDAPEKNGKAKPKRRPTGAG